VTFAFCIKSKSPPDSFYIRFHSSMEKERGNWGGGALGFSMDRGVRC
jgi:hypothetical protein